MYNHYKIVPENPDECGPNCKRAQETIAQDFYDIVYKAQSKNTEDAELGPERVVYLVDKFKKEVEDFKKFENLFRMIINFFYSLYKEKKSVHQTADLEFLATSLPTGVVYQILNLLAEKIDDFAAENGGILTYDNNAKIKIYLYLGHYFYIRMENKDYNTDTNVRLKRMQKERSTQKGMDAICALQETGTTFEALSSEQKAIVIKVTSGFEQFIGGKKIIK